eukprot:CAMPEP_0181090574 /NCGR_PEP_ID=MMETSP1071-20121207/7932_1 /TAXON_ID=35127 /ORGANISM="Thalassiosira sp., Strain NH16" /LENGTH=162 /DNA_ID=CAMNT_0023172645 /DNA_START=982 /DNA_END=1467 /DNA_ORIENTATION=+
MTIIRGLPREETTVKREEDNGDGGTPSRDDDDSDGDATNHETVPTNANFLGTHRGATIGASLALSSTLLSIRARSRYYADTGGMAAAATRRRRRSQRKEVAMDPRNNHRRIIPTTTTTTSVLPWPMRPLSPARIREHLLRLDTAATTSSSFPNRSGRGFGTD